MKRDTAAVVRASIARRMCGEFGPTMQLGEVTLHSHQVEGVARIRRLFAECGGALLADDVGLGKTFVALALAREMGGALVLAPAALRQIWRTAAERMDVPIQFQSLEQLSRGRSADSRSHLVIVDEAHHLRSTSSRRFALACSACNGANVLLMTATPVQNSVADLRALLSIFLGERAHALPVDRLARFVVRRLETNIAGTVSLQLPAVCPPRWLDAVPDQDCLDRLWALPPPLPPVDGDGGGVLLTYSLARQWASSRAALQAALSRRLARAHAMRDALRAGRLPTRAEVSAWCFADGVQQLTFPELAASTAVDDGPRLLVQLEEHVAGVRALAEWLAVSPDPDVARASSLRRLLRAHSGERIVAFSEYADTIASLYRLLAPHERIAMLTHTGGRVAGGPLNRREVLARFAPGASHRTPASERIDLLLTTDVLSEGVSLQDASVVVHIDLAWNPARLEQRVGRLRRLGASRDRIFVYMFPPPAPAERLLMMEARLRVKLGDAARTLGIAGTILPGLPTWNGDGSATREERILGALRSWLSESSASHAVMGAVRAERAGAIACIRRGDESFLIAVDGTRVTDSREVIETLVRAAAGDDAALPERDGRAIADRVHGWLARRALSEVVDLAALRVARSRRDLLRRVNSIALHTPRHVQPRLASLVRAARSAATAMLSAGAERVLDELTRAPMHDEAWLCAVGEFASLHARGASGDAAEIVALLVLVAD